MKVIIERVKQSQPHIAYSESDIVPDKVTVSIEKLPSMDASEWIVLKEALDQLVSVVKEFNV